MVYSENNLEENEIKKWCKEHFPEIVIKARKLNNKYAQARYRKTGDLLVETTSNFKLKQRMEGKEFKEKLRQIKSSEFGFETAIFKGAGY